MATKKLKKKVQRKPAARKAENPVVDSAKDIWLAGLGAFSLAQQESEKALEQGGKMFERLVKEGSKLEKQTRKDVEGAFGDMRDEFENRVKDFRSDVETRVKDFRGEVESRVGARKQTDKVREQAEKFRKQANQNWDKLEGFFEERVARVLSRLGIPSRDDIDSLNKRVQELSRTVASLEKSVKAKPARKAAPKKAAKKAAPKKAAPKKAAAKKATRKKAATKAEAPKAEAPKAEGSAQAA
jgi:poly(hydroxyalkanoate) granule-associated protein